MSGRFSCGGRDRAAATDSENALAAAAGRLPSQAASICFTRSVSAARRSRSCLECLATIRPFDESTLGAQASVAASAAIVAYPSIVSLFTLVDPGNLISPTFVAAFDGWVDAGSAATTALEHLVDDAAIVAEFDADVLFDYRARRPPLEIVDGRLTELTWHQLVDTARPARRTRPPGPRRSGARLPLASVHRGRRRARPDARGGRMDQPRRDPGGRATHAPRADPGDGGVTRAAARRDRAGSGGRPAGAIGPRLGARAGGRRGRHPRARLLRAGPALRVGALRDGRGRAAARARQPPRGRRSPPASSRQRPASSGAGSIPRRGSTRRRGAMSSGSRRCTTSSACRRATTSSRTSSGSFATRAARDGQGQRS